MYDIIYLSTKANVTRRGMARQNGWLDAAFHTLLFHNVIMQADLQRRQTWWSLVTTKFHDYQHLECDEVRTFEQEHDGCFVVIHDVICTTLKENAALWSQSLIDVKQRRKQLWVTNSTVIDVHTKVAMIIMWRKSKPRRQFFHSCHCQCKESF